MINKALFTEKFELFRSEQLVKLPDMLVVMVDESLPMEENIEVFGNTIDTNNVRMMVTMPHDYFDNSDEISEQTSARIVFRFAREVYHVA